MRILFYLPVITPWWFDSIAEPLIRLLARDHEVHVLAPAPWSGTGIGGRELAACADLTQVQWHIVDDENHPSMRTNAVERAGIINFVTAIGPDYVLCRSADCDTVNAFPGVVRHIMEGGAAPLSMSPDWIVLQEQPFDHGLLPDLDAGQRAELDGLIGPTWSALFERARPTAESRKAFRAWAGLPTDRPILALPLEYEHPENFFPVHRIGAFPNHRFVSELAETLDDSAFLAITNHPLNEKHVDNRALVSAIASHGPRMRLFPETSPDGGNVTQLLAREAAGMLIGDSKVYALAGFFGTPIVRQSRFKTGAWLNAYDDLHSLLSALETGTAVGADPDDARTWFAFHIANNIFGPNAPDLTAAELLDRMDRPFDPARWAPSFARFDAMQKSVQ